MISYQDLCQQHHYFQRKQKGKEALLLEEIEIFREQLAEKLGLKEKRYAKSIADESTEPYVQTAIVCTNTETIDEPEITFDLTVMLEDAPNSYPKYPFEQTLQVHFIQAGWISFRFIKERPELVFCVNITDNNEVKYQGLVEAYLQLLMKRLSC